MSDRALNVLITACFASAGFFFGFSGGTFVYWLVHR